MLKVRKIEMLGVLHFWRSAKGSNRAHKDKSLSPPENKQIEAFPASPVFLFIQRAQIGLNSSLRRLKRTILVK